MANESVTPSIEQFQKTISELNINIHTDDKWPIITGEILKNKSFEYQLDFWLKLDEFFTNYETDHGHCHKGNIYWNITPLFLQKGDLDKCFEYLNKSKIEDDLLNPLTFTASKGLLSILHPLFYRFSSSSATQMTKDIKDFYNSLNPEEKLFFASQLFESHNNCATNKMVFILPNFFNFIIDQQLRQIIFDTYQEIKNILPLPADSYFTCIFGIGSVVEAMIDDLFTRNENEIWKVFKNNAAVQLQIEQGSPLKSTDYPLSTTLNRKIAALRMMSYQDICPLPKSTLLQMSLIGEYRDLIHPRRRLDFQFKANYYVALFLFTMISQIAGNFWPSEVSKHLSTSTQ